MEFGHCSQNQIRSSLLVTLEAHQYMAAALIFLLSQTVVLKELEQVTNVNQKQEIALTLLLSKSSTYIIKWIRVFLCLTCPDE